MAAQCAADRIGGVGDKSAELQSTTENAADSKGTRLGLCIANEVGRRSFSDYFRKLRDEPACPSFELVTVLPNELARSDLRDQMDALFVVDVPGIDAAGVAGLHAFTQSGGVLLAGPRALRRTVGGDPCKVRTANARMVDYAFTPLGEIDAARLWGNFRYSDVRLATETPLYPDLDALREIGGIHSVSQLTGVLAMPTAGALSIAEGEVIDTKGDAEVGRADVLLAKRNGRGVVFRLALDCHPEIRLLDGLLRKLVQAKYTDTIVAGELITLARPSRLAYGSDLPACCDMPGSLAVRLEPFVLDEFGDPVLMSRKALSHSLERIAEIGATAVHLVVKLGSALVHGLGIETYPRVDPSRDILRESAELAGSFGLELVPTISCFDEHYPDQWCRPTDFVIENPEVVHLSRRQAESDLTDLNDVINTGERIFSSPHIPIVKQRIRRVATALAGAREFSRMHLECFRYKNDAGWLLSR